MLDVIEYRLTESEEQKQSVYRLRYEAFLREEMINPYDSQIITDRFDIEPNNWTFGLYDQQSLYGSIRLSLLTKQDHDSPSYEIYPDILDPLLDQGKKIIDPTRFVTNPDLVGKIRMLPYLTLKLCMIAADRFDADYILASVRDEHHKFYFKSFGHYIASEPRLWYGRLKPMSLLMTDYKKIRQGVIDRYPFMLPTEREKQMFIL